MLSEQYQQLLTAYVDGELSSRQTKLCSKLLRRSPEARKLLRQLQADSRELRALKTPALGIDLSKPILQSIHDFELVLHEPKAERTKAGAAPYGPGTRRRRRFCFWPAAHRMSHLRFSCRVRMQ